MAVEDTVAELRRELALAQQQAAQAAHQKTVAQASLEATMRDLNGKFGVDSLEAAQALIASLEADLAAEVSRVRESMERAGA